MGGPRITEFCSGFPVYLIQEMNNDNENYMNDIFVETNENFRRRRSTRHYFRGRVRGQTQSQYLNFGQNAEPGKAEAESTYEGSRAVVSKFNLLSFCFTLWELIIERWKQWNGSSSKSK